MPQIILELQGDGAWPDLKDREVINIPDDVPIKIIALPGGMQGGRDSIAIRFDTGEKSSVVAQTSVRLFLQAAAAIRGRFGEQ